MMKNKGLRIIGIITVANIVGKCTGFIKDVLLSNYYGVNEMTDALFLSMSIPTIILGIFTSTADSAIIPQYTRILLEGRKKADGFFSNIIGIISAVSMVATVLILLFPYQVVHIFASDFSELQMQYSVTFLRFFCGFGILHIWYVFFNAYNTVYEKTAVRAFLLFSNNIVVIIALLINHDQQMTGLIFGMVLANVLHGGLPMISAFLGGYRFTLKCGYRKEVREFIGVFLPIMGSAVLFEFNVFLDKLLASGLEVGAISTLDYGAKIPSIFDSMIVVGIAVVIIPQVSKLFIENKKEIIAQYITKYTWIVAVILIPFMLVAAIYSKEVVEIIYMRGAFTVNEVIAVSNVMLMYSPQIVFVAVNSLYTKFLHAESNSRTPFIIAMVGVILNAVLSIILKMEMGTQGIALATTVSNLTSCLLLHIYVRKKVGWGNKYIGKKERLSFLTAVIVMTIFLLLFRMQDFSSLKTILCGSICGGFFYVIIIFWGWQNFLKKEIYKNRSSDTL